MYSLLSIDKHLLRLTKVKHLHQKGFFGIKLTEIGHVYCVALISVKTMKRRHPYENGKIFQFPVPKS